MRAAINFYFWPCFTRNNSGQEKTSPFFSIYPLFVRGAFKKKIAQKDTLVHSR